MSFLDTIYVLVTLIIITIYFIFSSIALWKTPWRKYSMLKIIGFGTTLLLIITLFTETIKAGIEEENKQSAPKYERILIPVYKQTN